LDGDFLKRNLFVLLLLTRATLAADAGLYPDAKLTPGAVDVAATRELVCNSHPSYTATHRHVTLKTKREVFRRYGIDYAKHKDYEVDHFIPLEIGGLNAIENLWPQRWAQPGAHQKDVTENALHRSVCRGDISLHDAQEIARGDWYRYFLVYSGKRAPAGVIEHH
jgi:hypothetical protein